MNCQVLSKPTVISSTGGPVALPISSGKWHSKFYETRYVSFFCSEDKNRTKDTIRFWIWMPRHAYVFLSISLSIVPLQKVTLWKKLYVIYSFFFVRKIVAHLVTFIFYCIVMPATVLVPEVQVPIWGAVYIPSAITILNAVGTPRSSLLLQKYLSSAWSIVWHCFALLLHFLLLFFVHSKTSISPLFENRPFSERFFGKYLSNKFFRV